MASTIYVWQVSLPRRFGVLGLPAQVMSFMFVLLCVVTYRVIFLTAVWHENEVFSVAAPLVSLPHTVIVAGRGGGCQAKNLRL